MRIVSVVPLLFLQFCQLVASMVSGYCHWHLVANLETCGNGVMG